MKLASIGSGAIVDTAYDSIRDVDGIERVAVYSRSMEKAEAFAKKHGAKKAYDDLDKMFADPDIDTVYIASPNSCHYPQAKKALLAKKNVILEKPFTATMAQTQELFDLAEANGVMIFEAITNVHTANFGLLKDHLAEIGSPRECIFNFSQYSSRYGKYMNGDVANVFNPKMEGGALLDINIYNIHLAIGLFGEPEDVFYYPMIGWNGIDTSGVLIMRYPNLVVTCIGSKDSSADYLATIQGELGTFTITGGSTGKMQDVELIGTMQEDQKTGHQKISIDQGPHMTYEFMDFQTALAENNKEMYEACKKQTLAAQRVLEEATKQRDARIAQLGITVEK